MQKYLILSSMNMSPLLTNIHQASEHYTALKTITCQLCHLYPIVTTTGCKLA